MLTNTNNTQNKFNTKQGLEKAFDNSTETFGKERLAQAITTRTYAIGDTVEYQGKQYKIVDELDNGDYHLKNLAEPFDSFLTVLPK